MRPRLRRGIWIAAAGALLAFLATAPADGREIELTLLAGGQQTGDLASREGTVAIDGGLLVGAGVGWRVRPDAMVEIAWTHQQSAARADGWDGPRGFDVAVDAVELAGLVETGSGTWRPFYGLALGTTRLAGPDDGFADGWWLSGSAFGGVRRELGARTLLRLEARLSGILLSESGSLSCSSLPGQCSLALSGSLLGAFSVRAGLGVRF